MRNKRHNDFNRIASVYDVLVKLVFGGKLKEAQLTFLHAIPENSYVLIIGGGTGWFLEELITRKPSCHVCYVEASERMVRLSKRKISSQQIEFIVGTEKSLSVDKAFDVVITNFFLDLFSPAHLDEVVGTLRKHLRPDGYWLATDFVQTKKLKHIVLLRVMYLFFKMVSNIDADRLSDWQSVLRAHDILENARQTFNHGFVVSILNRHYSAT
jgi:ubiquinone/menaquinone biosynthesis C-methylase UbiE